MRLLNGLAALIILAIVTASTGGCLSSSTLVKLKTDGSGTIEQTLLMNARALESAGQTLAKAIGAEAQESAESPPPQSFDDVMKRADFAKVARELGPGVRFVSSTPLTSGDMQGAKIVFTFDDISKVAMSPVGVAPLPAGDRDNAAALFRLSRTPTGDSVLTIDIPDAAERGNETAPSDEPASPEEEDAQKQQVPPEMLEMMKQMMAGLRFDLAVEVDGRVVRTNSDFVAGSRVTVLELDFDQLVQQQDALKTLPTLTPGMNFARMKSVLKDIKGLKFTEPPVTIEFAER
jgi:hypothetical protein